MNTLFNQLRPASFRKIEFQVDATEFETGRRNQVHEYPQRDLPYAQDLGRKTREIEFDAFVIGNDYIDKANRLLDAMEQYGPGTLMHPWFGLLNVSVLSCRVAFDRSLNYAKFHLSFVESGLHTFPASVQSTQTKTRQAARNLETNATTFFAKVFMVAGKINAFAARALTMYGKVLNLLGNPVFACAGLLGLNSLPGNITSLASLFNVPIDLGWSFAGLLNFAHFTKTDQSTITTATISPLSSYIGDDKIMVPIVRGLIRMAGDAVLIAPTLPANSSLSARQMHLNDIAILAHTRLLLLVQAVGLSSYLTCAVYNDIEAVRNELAAALDAEALLTTDDDVYQALMEARSAIWTDLIERSRNSARLITMTPADVLPMLAIAYDYYEDACRDLEMAARNNIRHPGFVPAKPLMVLSM